MADLIDELCSACGRQTVEVELKYRPPWRLGIVWVAFLIVLGAAGLIPVPHGWRLTSTRVGAGVIAIFLREILGPRVAKRTACLRCRSCGKTSSRPAIHGLGPAT
jgi:hypothetical protein